MLYNSFTWIGRGDQQETVNKGGKISMTGQMDGLEFYQ